MDRLGFYVLSNYISVIGQRKADQEELCAKTMPARVTKNLTSSRIWTRDTVIQSPQS